MQDVTVDLSAAAPSSSTIPIALQTKDLCYHVSVSDKSKPRRCFGMLSRPMKDRQILDNVNFLARPGELSCVMGPSGSGKTTLLELISSRIQGNTTGEILINGAPITRAVMKRIAGYVKQKDILLPSATVREAITFSAKLRMPASVSSEERDRRVDAIIERLGLTKCADTQIGDELKRGISGGELKRTAIGIELITQPNLLFLDEPTSGLDASSAFTIVETLKNLARDDGTTIICTLHQPRSNIFYLFDRLVLLHSGRILYQGSPTNAIDWFASCGHVCPPFTNPPDYFMDIITDTDIGPTETHGSQKEPSMDVSNTPLLTSGQALPVEGKRKKKKKQFKVNDVATESGEADVSSSAEPEKQALDVDAMVERWKRSKRSKKVVKMDEDLPSVQEKYQQRQDDKPGLWSQTITLFERAWKNNIRNPLILWAQMFQHIFLALFIGLMYLHIGLKEDSLTDRAAAIFFSLLNVAWVPALTAAFVFPAERPLFNRERAGGFYRTLPYYLSATLSDFPIQIFLVILNATVTYWMFELNHSFERFILFIVLVFLCLTATQSVALLLSSVSATADVANLVAGLVILLFMAFGGFLVSTKNTPVYFYPIQYTSPFRYAYRAMMQNDLNGLTFPCNPTSGPCPIGNFTFIPTDPLYLNMTGELAPNQTCTYPCTITSGHDALVSFGLQDSSVLKDSMILLGMTIIWRVLIFLSLEFIQVGAS